MFLGLGRVRGLGHEGSMSLVTSPATQIRWSWGGLDLSAAYAGCVDWRLNGSRARRMKETVEMIERCLSMQKYK
jgi:hypothetical protein